MTTYTYQTIDPPGSTYTIAQSINSDGQIVGFYYHSQLNNGQIPPAAFTLTQLTSICWDKSSGSTTPLASAD